MYTTSIPTDQRAGVRPISFVLDNGGFLSSPVTLKIRPTDLTRQEPLRVSVHQTLGRGVQGWADNFGEGMPSVVIAGNTGWRAGTVSGLDGAQAFDQLNELVVHDYSDAKQFAIDTGRDPAGVKLLFVDMLDGFTWNVVPTTFVLRRNKSQPLLYQYNISLQAIATDIDNPLMILPFFGDIPAGLNSLGTVVDRLGSIADRIRGWIAAALAFKDKLLGPIAATIARFTAMARQVFSTVQAVVSDVKNAISDTANSLISIASELASVGIGIYRTLASIRELPDHLRAALSNVGGAFNEAYCIFKNSLRPRKVIDDYEGLYGASNCSSTTGGRPYSPYANLNAFELMQPERPPFTISSTAYSSINSLTRSDPVLAPMSFPEIGRHVDNINSGLTVEAGAMVA